MLNMCHINKNYIYFGFQVSLNTVQVISLPVVFNGVVPLEPTGR